MVRVKICGITRLEDARLAVELGADALGFNFYENSPRCLAPEDAWNILRKLPAPVATVGVFVNWGAASVVALAKSLRLAAVQLHGDESGSVTAECAKHVPVIKAFGTAQGFSLAELRAHRAASAFLLDSAREKRAPRSYGGTGRLADWRIAGRAARSYPVILAGGLTPENVGEAIASVRPFAVDVAGGIESRAGVKDSGKLRAFLAEVARADPGLLR
jgi:phosphoribosylanthranilate isomerase